MKVLGIVLALFVVSGAAGQNLNPRAEMWFVSLPESDRLEIQSALALIGDYDALVDGEYGPSTERAIRAFQTRRRLLLDGEFNADEMSYLRSDAVVEAQRLGVQAVSEPRSGQTLYLPTKVLTERSVTGTGTIFSTSDNEFTVETVSYPSAGNTLAGYRDSIVQIMRQERGVTVEYSTVANGHFVVSGRLAVGRYYLFMQEQSGQFVGYMLGASPKYAREGAVTSVLARSYYAPRPVDPPAQQPPASEPPGFRHFAAEGDRIGAFLLPGGDQTAIVLDGPIGANTPLEFLRALRERPGASKVLLNSDGGLVSSGLIIAQGVFDRRLSTVVPTGYGCYSACAYIFFAGTTRTVEGELGVHQIHSDNGTQEGAQYSLSDVLDMLHQFDVSQRVVSIMLRTLPNEMHVFDPEELVEFGINRVTKNSSVPSGPDNAEADDWMVSEPPAAIGAVTTLAKTTKTTDQAGFGRWERILAIEKPTPMDEILGDNGFTGKMIEAIKTTLESVYPSTTLPNGAHLRILFGPSRTSDVLIPYRLSIYVHDAATDTDRHAATVALTDRGSYVLGLAPEDPKPRPSNLPCGPLFDRDGLLGKVARGCRLPD